MYVYDIATYFFRTGFSALTFQRFERKLWVTWILAVFWRHSFWNSWQSNLKTFLGAGPFSSKPIGCSRLTYIPITCAVHRAVRDWQCSADENNVIGMYVSTFQGVRQLSCRRSPPPRLPHPHGDKGGTKDVHVPFTGLCVIDSALPMTRMWLECTSAESNQ